jgi:hypothetical protein
VVWAALIGFFVALSLSCFDRDSIIGFGSIHYVYETGRVGDMPAARFSPRKANLTSYVGDDFEGGEALYARLGKHIKSVACLYINKLDDVDLDVLHEIIARQYAEDSHQGGDPSN